jgi:hypothetical protein
VELEPTYVCNEPSHDSGNTSPVDDELEDGPDNEDGSDNHKLPSLSSRTGWNNSDDETPERRRSKSKDLEEITEPVAPPTMNRCKRITLSAQATSGLQRAEMRTIVDEAADGGMKQPKVCGLPCHYEVTNVWGAADPHHHTMMGTRPAADSSVRPVCFTEVFKAVKTPQVLNELL